MMLKVTLAKNEADHAVAVIETQEVADVLTLLRGMKRQFPELYQQVGLEIVLPANGIAVPKQPDNKI